MAERRDDHRAQAAVADVINGLSMASKGLYELEASATMLQSIDNMYERAKRFCLMRTTKDCFDNAIWPDVLTSDGNICPGDVAVKLARASGDE